MRAGKQAGTKLTSIGPLPRGLLSWSVSSFLSCFLLFPPPWLGSLPAISLVICLGATHCLSHHNMLSFFCCSLLFPVPLPSHLCFFVSLFLLLLERNRPKRLLSLFRARAIPPVSSFQPTGAAETIKRRETGPGTRKQYQKRRRSDRFPCFCFLSSCVRACCVYARLRLGLTSYTAQRRLCSSPVLVFLLWWGLGGLG